MAQKAIKASEFAAKADAAHEWDSYHGMPAVYYFRRDWVDESDDAVNGGRYGYVCYSELIGVVEYDADIRIDAVKDRDECYADYGCDWVWRCEASDAEMAENE